MNYFLGLMMMGLFSLGSAMADEAAIYCYVDSQQIDVLGSSGLLCSDLLLEPGGIQASHACFTGSPEGAAEILNSLRESGYFNGTDGLYIASAEQKDVNQNSKSCQVSYRVVEEPSEQEWTNTLDPCL